MTKDRSANWEPGENFERGKLRDGPPHPGPHIWKTLGYQRTLWEPGEQHIEWKAPEEYAFPTASGYIVHGGMVSTILDSAMGGACWTLLDGDEVFLTANLNVEFHRATRPGLLRAEGRVVSRTKRLLFCSSELYDDEDQLTASARCTQVILPARGGAARPWQRDETEASGEPEGG